MIAHTTKNVAAANTRYLIRAIIVDLHNATPDTAHSASAILSCERAIAC